MSLTRRDAEHVFESLRSGTVPGRGLDVIAEGIDMPRREIHRMLTGVEAGEGLVKFLRGGYGCGKTFMSMLSVHDARQKGFATSFVVVSDNDLHFHKFEELYRKVVSSLGTSACPQGALGDILDRWIGKIEEDLIAADRTGQAEMAPDFEEKVRAKLEEKLGACEAPHDMVRVLQTFFQLKQEGNLTEAAALLSWLSGSSNVAAGLKKRAGIRGEIGSTDAMAYLRGMLEIIKAAGYSGLLIVIDEAETIIRTKSDVRKKSMNGIRQITDVAKDFPGLLWLFTGTPNFYDDRKGVAGVEALNDRIQFDPGGGFPSPRQPQLELKPFDRERLNKVALRLRALYPEGSPEEMERRISDEVIGQLIENVTAGFKGDVGTVPRHFLRQFVNMLDQVITYPDYNAAEHVGFVPGDMKPEEEFAVAGKKEEPGFEGATLDI